MSEIPQLTRDIAAAVAAGDSTHDDEHVDIQGRVNALIGKTYIDAVARGLAKDGSDQSAFLNSLLAEGSCVVIPGGGNVTLDSAVSTTKTYSELIGYGGPTLDFTNAGDGLTIGPGSGGSGIEPSGYVQGIKIQGSGGTSPQTAQGGATGLTLDGMRQHRVVDVYVEGYDIAFDFINNCYGSTMENCRALFGRNNVGLNLRTGPQSGSDLTFTNCWLMGRIAAVYVAGDGIGYEFQSGQYACGHDDAAAAEGVFVINKDYLTNSTSGKVPGIHFRAVVFEGWYSAPAFLTHGQVQASVVGCRFLGTRLTDLATRILEQIDPTHSSWSFLGNYIRGEFSAADLLNITGTQGSRNEIFEAGWYSSTPSTVNSVSQSGDWMPALQHQSNVDIGMATYRESDAVIKLGGGYLRFNGATLESSTDGSTWSAV